MEQIHVRPHLSSPKPGGMMDAIKRGRFIEYLADKWPDEKTAELLDEQYENETNSIIEEKYEKTN